MNLVKILLIFFIVSSHFKKSTDECDINYENHRNLHSYVGGNIFRLSYRTCISRKIKIKSNKNNCILIILLLCGDVELNPGPVTNNVSIRLHQLSYSNSMWGEQPVENIPIFPFICVYLCIYLCHAYWPNEKRYRPEICHTYSHWPYLKTGFLFIRKNHSWRLLASKNCRVTWIFRISPRLPCLYFNYFKF